MTIIRDKTCPLCHQYGKKAVKAEDGQTLGEVIESGWLPPHHGCCGKVLLMFKTGNFTIDPTFPTSYTITVPFSPKSAKDLLAAGTPAQWRQVKRDLDRIYDNYLKTINSWGIWDSIMINSKYGEKKIADLIEEGSKNNKRLKAFIESSECDLLLEKIVHKRHYRACSNRVDQLLRIMKSYFKQNQIDFCFTHYEKIGVSFIQHARIYIIVKIIGDNGMVYEESCYYDPWLSIKYTFFTRLFIQHIEQINLKVSSGIFW